MTASPLQNLKSTKSQFANRKNHLHLTENQLNAMKKHNGMRPHDVAVMLKIASLQSAPWLMKDVAKAVGISCGEVSESIQRSVYAGLMSDDKRMVMRKALLEFIEFGLRYVFPAQAGRMARGIPTGYSAPSLSAALQIQDALVWPDAHGSVRGQSVEPLYKTAPRACLNDKSLYELLTLVDAVRMGRTRERTMAMKELRNRIS